MHLSFLDYDVTFCTLRNIPGMAYKVPWDSINTFLNDQKVLQNTEKNKEEFCTDKSCVYLLIGEKTEEKDDGKTVVYAGRTDAVDRRLKEHKKKESEDYIFQHAVVFFRADYDLNKGLTDHIERNIIERLRKQENIVLLTNVQGNTKSADNAPKQITLGLSDRNVANAFIESILLLTKALGYDIFDITGKVVPPQVESIENVVVPIPPLFIYKRGDKKDFGKGHPVKDGFVVSHGSEMSETEKSYIRPSYKALRKKLIDEQIVVNGNFVEDFQFASATLAASVINGASANGHTVWRTENGETLGDWFGRNQTAITDEVINIDIEKDNKDSNET
jgi:predicted GIY-YIG superfamily endonuclease